MFIHASVVDFSCSSVTLVNLEQVGLEATLDCRDLLFIL